MEPPFRNLASKLRERDGESRSAKAQFISISESSTIVPGTAYWIDVLYHFVPSSFITY
jgi:hypothetical protein